MSAPVCKSCGQPVLWRVTVDGRRIPLDPRPAPGGVVHNLGDGRCRILSKVNAAEAREHGAQLYVPHHATCPQAGRHRVTRSQLALDL